VKRQLWKHLGLLLGNVAVYCIIAATVVSAAAPAPQNPKDGASGLQGRVQTPAPTSAATIATPSNGQAFSKMPITINGLCTSGLLVKLFANNIFIGSALCINGSYSLQADLFDGRNDLVARQFDALDQPGPDSNTVTVTYNNSAFENLNVPQLTLTSIYARKGADPGATLLWPITISGGTGPYAISVDWGDGKGQSLYSQSFAGTFNIDHIYQSAGQYVVIVKATDKNGLTAYLQLVGQANGSGGSGASGSASKDGGTNVITIIKVLWIPAALMIPLILLSFWLGRRYELSALRKHLESEALDE
jgi:hypothetical protein